MADQSGFQPYSEATGFSRCEYSQEWADWSSATRIRAVFRDAFVSAGFRYFSLHSFRYTLLRLSLSAGPPLEEFKFRVNLGHDKALTNFLISIFTVEDAQRDGHNARMKKQMP
jgi:hypothetical protein